ncbi:cyclin-dependent kinase 11B-like isoform X2 [Prunus avium]|uniref:Cyclin-dependent kinase 11B-like isoform X2 n=1 Tax=Prunus avium TaxID=42229 RepID=A0A6P5RZJ1_PRUAV|nr:cyclin-dependent kinase 11B-like isoform X2 [Prunus avium]
MNYNVYDEPIKAISESAEWIFLAINLGLEMLSAAFDQASSPRKPHYALFGMLLAIAAVLISIWELIYKGKKERVVLRRWGMLWWFYHPPPRNTLYGTLPDIYGLVAGISQCICSIAQYVYYLRHVDNPFKASLLPAIFLLCLGGSKLSNNRMNANTTDNKDSRENSSSTEETSLHAIAANIPSLDDQEVKGNIVDHQRGATVAGRELLADDGYVGGGWDQAMVRRVLQWHEWEQEREWEWEQERELERERLWQEREWEWERERERERERELELERERLWWERERLRLCQESEQERLRRERLRLRLRQERERLWQEQERLWKEEQEQERLR